MNIFVPIYVLVILICVYIIFPRQINNTIIRIFRRKQYVICHMIRANTDFVEKYLVVPTPDKITSVGGKGDYNLDERFADRKRKNRWNFILHEGDSIPKVLNNEQRQAFYGNKVYKTIISFRFPNDKELLFTAKAVHNALNNNIAEYLFTKKKDIYYLALMLVIAILVVALIYTAYVLNQTNQIMMYFANNPPQTPQIT